jgi:nucleoside-diphosphate-sugar epimerase
LKIGVTGGAGFVGGYVVEELRSRGHEVVAFDHMGRAEMLGDVRDATSMMELAAHVDGIIHLAACLGTQETVKNPRPAAETNIMGGLNFLEACAHYSIPGAYIGVGNHWFNNPYSITKTTIERFVAMYNAERGTRINIVRAMNAYGPRQAAAAPYGPGKVRKITPAFICRALNDEPVEVYGDGTQVSDMVYVSDVAKALVLAIELAARGDVLKNAVEVGPSTHTTVQQVAEMIIRICRSRSKIINLPMRPGEIPRARVVADTSTLSLLGMSTDELVDLEDGMKLTVQYFRKLMARAA